MIKNTSNIEKCQPVSLYHDQFALVDMAESFFKWLFNRSVWKIFLTFEEEYFSSHVMDFSVKKKIEVLTKQSQ